MSSAAQTARHTHHRIPLRTYVDYRLGRDEPWWRQSLNVLVRPLTAASFAGFWRSATPPQGRPTTGASAPKARRPRKPCAA
jgi:hypothetical protein